MVPWGDVRSNQYRAACPSSLDECVPTWETELSGPLPGCSSFLRKSGKPVLDATQAFLIYFLPTVQAFIGRKINCWIPCDKSRYK